jgi:putative transposase
MRLSVEDKRAMIEVDGELSVRAQCGLLELPRSSWYYQAAEESSLNLELMFEIDKEYMLRPFYGSPKMTLWLRKLGFEVNHKRVERLMRIMGLKSVAPGPHTSKPSAEHIKYPYLLRDVHVTRTNHAWCTDITYIPLRYGYMYLVAVMDWYSRYVLSWELSNTMDVEFCIAALDSALSQGKPEIFNSDQGSQFTSCHRSLKTRHFRSVQNAPPPFCYPSIGLRPFQASLPANPRFGCSAGSSAL